MLRAFQLAERRFERAMRRGAVTPVSRDGLARLAPMMQPARAASFSKRTVLVRTSGASTGAAPSSNAVRLRAARVC